MTQRIAVVTGGTRGIGAAISVALQAAGHKVIANYFGNKEEAGAFQKTHGIEIAEFDVSNYDATNAAFKTIESAHGGVDIVVNNAGITRDSVLHKMTPQDWEAVIKVNLSSVFNTARAVIDGMRARQFGRIISISSVNGLAGQAGQTNYSAAKAGIIGFTKALAREGATKGITANVVAPGYVDTSMVRAVPEDVLEKIIATVPVKRLGTVDEIARAVVFLAAEDAGFITGATLSVNGGLYMA